MFSCDDGYQCLKSPTAQMEGGYTVVFNFASVMHPCRFEPGASSGHLIRGQLTTPAISFPFCRSLLAGDSGRTLTDHTLNRLQAGSYIPTKPEQAGVSHPSRMNSSCRAAACGVPL